MIRKLLCFVSFATLAVASALPCLAQQQLVEIRYYHFRSEESAAKFDEMMESAAMPLLESAKVGPVGVFEVKDSSILDENDRVTIVPYESMEQLLATRERFAEDQQFLEKASDYLTQVKGDPAFENLESMLLLSFEGMPTLKVPAAAGEDRRLFELRTYRSENEVQQHLKVQMFNEGEMAIFKKTGLNAVFYGDAIVAPNLPQLTYLLVHENEEAKAKSWQTFINSPEWKALSGEEQYQVIKLQITSQMLQATDYSAIK